VAAYRTASSATAATRIPLMDFIWFPYLPHINYIRINGYGLYRPRLVPICWSARSEDRCTVWLLSCGITELLVSEIRSVQRNAEQVALEIVLGEDEGRRIGPGTQISPA